MVAAAIGGAAVIGAGAQMASGSKAASASKKGADAQLQLGREQLAEGRRQYDQTRADYAPYREMGHGALQTLGGLYGQGPMAGKIDPTKALEATPGYQFRMDQSLKALERMQNARGQWNSGGTFKALTRYASGVASDEYNNYANRLAALAGVGQTATGSTAAAGQSYMSNYGQAVGAMQGSIGNSANARASSYINTGSAINSGINNLASLYLYQRAGGFNPVQTGT